MQTIQDKPTMSMNEAAKFIGVSLPTMYTLSERNDFTALVRIGERRKLILKSKLIEWLEAEATKAHRG